MKIFALLTLVLLGANAHAQITRASVDAAFSSTILSNFTSNPNINATFASLGTAEIAILSTRYVATGGNVQTLANIAAQRLNAQNLVRFNTAFGMMEIDSAVGNFAPYSVQSVYFTTPVPPPFLHSHAQMQAMGIVTAAPTLDYTIYEVYLDYLTSGLTVESALAMTAMYVGQVITTTAGVAYAVGTGVYNISEYITPGSTNWIGDLVACAACVIQNLPAIPTQTTIPDLTVTYNEWDWNGGYAGGGNGIEDPMMEY